MRPGFALIGLAIALSAAARAQDSLEPWPDLAVVVPVARAWSVSGEAIGRIAPDDGRPSQLELRLQLGHAIGKHFVVWVGYVHQTTYRPGLPAMVENQSVEQINWKIGEIASIHVSTRTRLEQRVIIGADALEWRLREQLRLSLPLRRSGPALVVWSEPFIALNYTSVARTTFDQIRSFAGLSVPLAKGADVEFDYLNQHLHRVTGDSTNDVVPVVFNLRL